MANLTHEERVQVMREMRDNAMLVAKEPVLITLKATRGKSIPGYVIQFYTRMNVAGAMAELCGEIMRLRDGLAAIAEGSMQCDVVDYAREILDGPREEKP